MELGIPITSSFLVSDSEETRIEDSMPSMEDTDRPLSAHEPFGHTKQNITWRFREWHMQIYMERQVDTAYR